MPTDKLSPIKFPDDYHADQSEQKIKLLLDGENLQPQINASKAEARNSLRWGAFIIILTLLTSIGIAVVSKRDTHAIGTSVNAICCNGQVVQSQGINPLYDYSIYGFIVISLTGLGLGWVLVKHYVATSKKVISLNDQRQLLNELRATWEMSKGLADWVEKEPKSTVRDKKVTSKTEDSKNSSQVEEGKSTTKGKEYSYPRQLAQQQIIETLLSRISK